MENERLTNIPDFFGELDGGVFENKLAAALNEVALGVLNNGQKGKVQVTFDLSRLSNSLEEKRVTIQHRLSFTKPTRAVSLPRKTQPKPRCTSIAAANSLCCRKIRPVVHAGR
jgi:hypothetical protein